ncbi:hypothetical protein A7K91_22910 [Paenibacillus oryzae]|uniref:Uncharacterized protein n=1 Tax=Paenibacillus oryzae TaxID=1844972 RepID=A0A1A5YCS9_9BACL|nr:hypothetical protein A7K91_22910 [Paenibacillus oryzae]
MDTDVLYNVTIHKKRLLKVIRVRKTELFHILIRFRHFKETACYKPNTALTKHSIIQMQHNPKVI